MAFASSVKSVSGTSDCEPHVVVETCDEESQDDSEEWFNLQEAQNQLFKECGKQKIFNKHILKKLNESETKNESLCAKLHDVNYVIDSLILDNSLLVDKLKHILSSQKPFGDKCGLGFDKNASTSKITLATREI